MSQAESTNPQGALTFRAMSSEDIPFGLKLSSAAGWNQTEADWKLLLDQSVTGSYIASLEGIDAGTVTTVSYQNHFHWIGMVQVAEEFRRKGIGRALLDRAIESVRDQGAVCLDATPAGKRLYDNLGFKDIYGLARCLRQPAPVNLRPSKGCPPLVTDMLPAVGEYDLPVFGADRLAILVALQRRAPQLAFYATQAGKLAGYCLGRDGSRFTQIGPIVVNNLEVARDLLLTALKSCEQQGVILDVPYHEPGWNQLLSDLGFIEQRPFIRMSMGAFPLPEQHSKQLAIAGPEIG